MKKSFLGVIAATMLCAMLCACGAKVEVDPPIVDSTEMTEMTDSAKDMADSAKSRSHMGSTNGLAQGDGMQ